MKAKLDVDVDDYVILGACNPKMAHQAMTLEPRIGAMLPCNVIVRAVGDGVEVSAVDPVASMAAVENPKLGDVATKVARHAAAGGGEHLSLRRRPPTFHRPPLPEVRGAHRRASKGGRPLRAPQTPGLVLRGAPSARISA